MGQNITITVFIEISQANRRLVWLFISTFPVSKNTAATCRCAFSSSLHISCPSCWTPSVCMRVCVSFGVLPGASLPPCWSDKQKKSLVLFCSNGCSRCFTPVSRCQSSKICCNPHFSILSTYLRAWGVRLIWEAWLLGLWEALLKRTHNILNNIEDFWLKSE